VLCDPVEAAQGKAVNDLLAAALGANEAAVAQARQVGAHPRLRLPDGCHQLADGELTLFEQLEDVKPGRVTEDAKEARRGGAVGWREHAGIHIWKAGYHFLVKVTLQYFDGCPHWKLADERLARVLRGLPRGKVTLEYQRIDSPETAEQIGFYGSPTILVDGRDPFATGTEPVGMSCRVFRSEDGAQGAPTEAQLRGALGA